MTDRILRPIAGGLGQNGPQNAPMLLTCSRCGAQVLVPQQIAQVAAQQHEAGCIGRKVDRLLELLSPTGPDGT